MAVKQTAHRPSESHRKWVKNRAGEKVLNTAYDASSTTHKESKVNARSSHSIMGEVPMSKREAAALAKSSTDELELEELLTTHPDSKNVLSGVAKNEAAGADALESIYSSPLLDSSIKSSVLNAKNVPLDKLSDEDYKKAILSNRHLNANDSRNYLSDDRADFFVARVPGVYRGDISSGPIREAIKRNRAGVQTLAGRSPLSKEEITQLSDECLISYANANSSEGSQYCVDEMFKRGRTREVVSRVAHSPNSFNKETVDKAIGYEDLDKYSADRLFQHASKSGRESIKSRFEGFEAKDRVLTVADATGKSPKELLNAETLQPSERIYGGTYQTHRLKVDVKELERQGISKDDVPALVAMTTSWNASSNWNPESGIFSYSIDSSG